MNHELGKWADWVLRIIGTAVILQWSWGVVSVALGYPAGLR